MGNIYESRLVKLRNVIAPSAEAKYDQLSTDIKKMIGLQARLEGMFSDSLYRRLERYFLSSGAKSRSLGHIQSQVHNLEHFSRRLMHIERRSKRLLDASSKKSSYLPSYITNAADRATKAKERIQKRSGSYALLKQKLEQSSGNLQDFVHTAAKIEGIERSISKNYHRYAMANDCLAPAKAESDLTRFYEGVLSVTMHSAERMRNMSSRSCSILRKVTEVYTNIDNKDLIRTLRDYIGFATQNVCSITSTYGRSIYALEDMISHKNNLSLLYDDISGLEESVGDIIDSTLEWNSELDDVIETIRGELF
ncbi:MAG: hypothetical protein V1906_00950 [Candidatus Woesearchaeota archaeon]